MTIDAEALKQNFETLVEHEVTLSHKTYDLLFAAHPELLDLFTAKHSAAGAQMVRETLMYAVDHLNSEDWVASNMASLGTKHEDYGVEDEMYRWYADALLAAMAHVTGDEWTQPLEEGWRMLFDQLAHWMVTAHSHGGGAQAADPLNGEA